MIKTYAAAFAGILIGIIMVNAVGRATAADPIAHNSSGVVTPIQSKGGVTGPLHADLPAWRLTVSEPQALVDIDPNGTVTIHGDVHTRAFWERVAAAFKEDCPQHTPIMHDWSGTLTPGISIAPGSSNLQFN